VSVISARYDRSSTGMQKVMSSGLTANNTCSLVNLLFRREREIAEKKPLCSKFTAESPMTTVHPAAAASCDAEPWAYTHGPRSPHTRMVTAAAATYGPAILEVVVKATLLIIIGLITTRLTSGTGLTLLTQSRL